MVFKRVESFSQPFLFLIEVGQTYIKGKIFFPQTQRRKGNLEARSF